MCLLKETLVATGKVTFVPLASLGGGLLIVLNTSVFIDKKLIDSHVSR